MRNDALGAHQLICFKAIHEPSMASLGSRTLCRIVSWRWGTKIYDFQGLPPHLLGPEKKGVFYSNSPAIYPILIVAPEKPHLYFSWSCSPGKF